MSISFQVLGDMGRDNALHVALDSGKTVERLMFDCGEGCSTALSVGERQAVDHLFFSHLHMDHVAGFDGFFRCTYGRTAPANQIWGPPGTAAAMQHRFQGFLWNLHDGMEPTSWRVTDIHPTRLHTLRSELSEAFAISHDEGTQPHDGVIWGGVGATVRAFALNHHTTSMAYRVDERPRINFDMARMQDLGLRPGPWLKQVRPDGAATPADEILINGTVWRTADLREKLMVETPGDSIAYLTDFLLDQPTLDLLLPGLQGCRTLVCDCQYRHADLELAQKHRHMTARLAGELAKQVGAQELVLIHLSERYSAAEWLAMRDEARAVFPAARFPAEWLIP